MSITTVEDVLDIIETDLTDDAIQKVIDRQEAWLASRVGDLEQFDPGIVADGVIELVYVSLTSRGTQTSEREGSHSSQSFQTPGAASHLRELVVRRLRRPAAGTIHLRSTVVDT
jgi:hypothetical protein